MGVCVRHAGSLIGLGKKPLPLARTSSVSVSCPPDLLGLLEVSPESAQISAPKRLLEDSGNLVGVWVSAGGLRVYSVELRAGRSATTTFVATPLAVRTDDGGHRLEEARPRCPLAAVVPSLPREHPCLRKDAFSTVRNSRSSFAESCVNVFLPARSHGPSTLAESSPPVFPQRHFARGSEARSALLECPFPSPDSENPRRRSCRDPAAGTVVPYPWERLQPFDGRSKRHSDVP